MDYIFILQIYTIFALFSNSAGFSNESEQIREEVAIEADEGQFPYLVRIYSSDGDIVSTCTGSVVGEDVILTAAHCCIRKENLFVVSGRVDHGPLWNNFPQYAQHFDGYFMYTSKKAFIHPDFTRTSDGLLHDICLIKLKQKMLARDGHFPVGISYKDLKNTTNCLVIGWGATENNHYQNRLYYADVKAEKIRRLDTDMIKLVEHTVCKGDSGGPLICNGKIYGIGSFAMTQYGGLNCEKDADDYYMLMREEKSFLKHHVKSSKGGASANVLSPLAWLTITIFIRNN